MPGYVLVVDVVVWKTSRQDAHGYGPDPPQQMGRWSNNLPA